MEIIEIAFISLCILTYLFSYYKDREKTMKSMRYSYDTFLNTFYLLLAGIALGGIVHSILPENLVIAFLGESQGYRSILFGVALGCVLPGGPYIRLPVVVTLLQLGAGIGAVTALLASFSLLYLPQAYAFLNTRVMKIQTLAIITGALFAGIIASFICGFL